MISQNAPLCNPPVQPLHVRCKPVARSPVRLAQRLRSPATVGAPPRQNVAPLHLPQHERGAARTAGRGTGNVPPARLLRPHHPGDGVGHYGHRPVRREPRLLHGGRRRPLTRQGAATPGRDCSSPAPAGRPPAGALPLVGSGAQGGGDAFPASARTPDGGWGPNRPSTMSPEWSSTGCGCSLWSGLRLMPRPPKRPLHHQRVGSPLGCLGLPTPSGQPRPSAPLSPPIATWRSRHQGGLRP